MYFFLPGCRVGKLRMKKGEIHACDWLLVNHSSDMLWASPFVTRQAKSKTSVEFSKCDME
jgi:hypothetical protein